METLAPGVTADPATSFGSALAPHCDLPAADRAGTADTGGIRYSTLHLDADTCYPSRRPPTLLLLPSAGNGDTVVLGAPDILYNNRLGKQGNASLALQLLGSRPHLVWFLPSLSDAGGTAADDQKSFLDLLPSGWLWGTLQLFVAAALAALWRARRLGPLVAEDLPVAVRASEAVEGRARLYRKADARDRAAAALRSGTRTRLAPPRGRPRVPGSHARSPAPRPVRPPARRRAGSALPPLRPAARRRRSPHLPRRPTRRPRKRGTPSMMDPTTDNAGQSGRPDGVRAALEALRTEVAKAVVGQDSAVTGLVLALLCRGHVLLEGVPGIAKTLLVRAMAAALDSGPSACSSPRI